MYSVVRDTTKIEETWTLSVVVTMMFHHYYILYFWYSNLFVYYIFRWKWQKKWLWYFSYCWWQSQVWVRYRSRFSELLGSTCGEIFNQYRYLIGFKILPEQCSRHKVSSFNWVFLIGRCKITPTAYRVIKSVLVTFSDF